MVGFEVMKGVLDSLVFWLDELDIVKWGENKVRCGSVWENGVNIGVGGKL